MKLHHIKVHNLNSLYGEQSADLDRDLQGASLFLVQGPTGSGKSTLMDAVSLALFAVTPRLTGTPKVVAEHIMSRGTGEAASEVEFSKLEGGSRVRYRARWFAKRARKKPDGNMQNVVRSLERQEADGTWVVLVSDTRQSHTDPVFDEVLEGFSAVDFQRSMLLAQGNFDAMLRAKAEDRAAILERLTDTAEYLNIGDRAARMNSAYKKRLDWLDARVKGISTVSPERLEEAERQATQAREADADHARELQRISGWITWRDAQTKLDSRRADAKVTALSLAAKVAGARGDLLALEEHERCADAFAQAILAKKASKRHEDLRGQLDKAQQKLPGLVSAEHAAERRAADAEAALTAVTAATNDLKAPLRQVRDTARAHARAVYDADQATTKAGRAATRAQDSAKQLSIATEEAKTAADKLASAREAAQAIAHDAPLRDALPGLEETYARITERERLVRTEATAITDAADQLQRSRHALATDTARLAQQAGPVEARLQEALTQATQARVEALGSAPIDQVTENLRGKTDAVTSRIPRLQDAVQRVREADDDETSLTQRLAAHRAQVSARETLQTQVTHAEASLGQAKHALDLAEAAVGPLRRILALREERDALVQGEACPLCGSAEHPFHDDPHRRAEALAIEETAAEAEARCASAAQQHQSAKDALFRAREKVVAAVDAEAVALGEVHNAQRVRDTSAELASRARTAAGLDDTATLQDVQAALTQSQRDAETARHAENQARALIQAEAEATSALQATREKLAGARQDLSQRATTLQAHEAGLDARRTRQQSARDALATLTSELREALRLHGLTSMFLDQAMNDARTRVTAFRDAQTALEGAASHREKMDRDREHAQTLAAQHEEDAKAAQQEAEKADRLRATAHEDAVAARAILADAWSKACALDPDDGPPRPPASAQPDTLEAHQHRCLSQATRRKEQARTDAGDARERLAVARTSVDQFTEQLRRLAQERDQELSARDAAIAALGLPDLAALHARYLKPETLAQHQATKRHLDDLRSKVSATTRLLDKQQQEQDASRPSDLPEDATRQDLSDRAQDIETARKAIHDQLTEAEAICKQAQNSAAALQQAKVDLEEARHRALVWQRLHKLIGTNNGKAFRIFAQALNLEQLLQAANHHLRSLNDRYRLRVERDEQGMATLEFVVEDTWRPGVPRSLKTLSGGESFLVSLALALGLSDLRTRSMPVETLLLDEGFGTLDHKTLEVAMGALRQLQSSGRQVGIISHVVGLQEAIEARILVEPKGDGRSTVRPDVRMN